MTHGRAMTGNKKFAVAAGMTLGMAFGVASSNAAHAQEEPIDLDPGGGENPVLSGGDSSASASASADGGIGLGELFGAFLLFGGGDLKVGSPVIDSDGCTFNWVAHKGRSYANIYQTIDPVEGQSHSEKCAQLKKELEMIKYAGEHMVENGDDTYFRAMMNNAEIVSETLTLASKINRAFAVWHYEEFGGQSPGSDAQPDASTSAFDSQAHMHVLDVLVADEGKDSLSAEQQRLYDKFDMVLNEDDLQKLRHIEEDAPVTTQDVQKNPEKTAEQAAQQNERSAARPPRNLP